jgi:protein ImuB
VGRTARAQVLLDGDERSREEQNPRPAQALLLCYRQRRWYVEGIYE